MPKILLVNDNRIVSRLINLSSEKNDYKLIEVLELNNVENSNYDIVLVDNDLFKDTFIDELLNHSIKYKTLGYIGSKGCKKPEQFDFILEKPFLPTDFVELINNNYEEEILNHEELNSSTDDSLENLKDLDEINSDASLESVYENAMDIEKEVVLDPLLTEPDKDELLNETEDLEISDNIDVEDKIDELDLSDLEKELNFIDDEFEEKKENIEDVSEKLEDESVEDIISDIEEIEEPENLIEELSIEEEIAEEAKLDLSDSIEEEIKEKDDGIENLSKIIDDMENDESSKPAEEHLPEVEETLNIQPSLSGTPMGDIFEHNTYDIDDKEDLANIVDEIDEIENEVKQETGSDDIEDEINTNKEEIVKEEDSILDEGDVEEVKQLLDEEEIEKESLEDENEFASIDEDQVAKALSVVPAIGSVKNVVEENISEEAIEKQEKTDEIKVDDSVTMTENIDYKKEIQEQIKNTIVNAIDAQTLKEALDGMEINISITFNNKDK